MTQEELLELECDVLIPAAKEEQITAANAGAVMSKLLQVATGWVYSSDKGIVALDNNERISALVDIINDTDKPAKFYLTDVDAGVAKRDRRTGRASRIARAEIRRLLRRVLRHRVRPHRLPRAGGKTGGGDQFEDFFIGDTVGDPFKDTTAVALNPIIKFSTLFGLLAVEIAVKMKAAAHSGSGSDPTPIIRPSREEDVAAIAGVAMMLSPMSLTAVTFTRMLVALWIRREKPKTINI